MTPASPSDRALAGRVRSKLTYYWRLVSRGDLALVWTELRRFLWSDDYALGLTRDLTIAYTAPPARVTLTVHTLDQATADALLEAPGADATDRREIERRRRLWDQRLGTAYVALDETGAPCFVQWAIPGDQASRIDRFFGGVFPHLAPDELLIEGTYVPPHARGKRIMADAMNRIALAAAPQHRRAITFVGATNEPSLRGSYAAGFKVYVRRLETWRLGRRRIHWFPVESAPDEPAKEGPGVPHAVRSENLRP